MTLKGNYSDLVSYAIGDVVGYQDEFYVRMKEPGAGINPIDTGRWEKLPKWLMLCAGMVMDGIGIADGDFASTKSQIEGINPDAKTIRLKSSTASSTKSFDITVDDDGELTATEYTPAT